jgi:hypothetical protein
VAAGSRAAGTAGGVAAAGPGLDPFRPVAAVPAGREDRSRMWGCEGAVTRAAGAVAALGAGLGAAARSTIWGAEGAAGRGAPVAVGSTIWGAEGAVGLGAPAAAVAVGSIWDAEAALGLGTPPAAVAGVAVGSIWDAEGALGLGTPAAAVTVGSRLPPQAAGPWRRARPRQIRLPVAWRPQVLHPHRRTAPTRRCRATRARPRATRWR